MNYRNKRILLSVGMTALMTVVGGIFDNSVSANSVNDYIISQNWQKQTSNKQIHEWLNHRDDVDMSYRHGKPEGVLVHETANESDKKVPNAIWSEIEYMLNNSYVAFVHSFVDGKQSVEIADPNYLSWGAGPAGNARFIQTEQVRVNSKNAFAHELYNLAVLQAQYLRKYNLTPSLGGTVWSHAMVSERLGHTDHTDPDGYWADMAARYFGTTYTMNDYQYLIQHVFDSMAPAKFKVGDKVQIANWAETESNGWDLKNRRTWVGTVKTVILNDDGYEYRVDYGDGNWNEHVLEQDLQTAPATKYSADDVVQISSGAVSEANGWNVTSRRNWYGIVNSVRIDNGSGSHYSYNVKFPNGEWNERVLEPDVKAAKGYKFAKGATVQISPNATSETTGWNLADHRNWVGIVHSVTPRSVKGDWEYWVTYPDGSRNEHVAERDLQQPAPAKYSAVQNVQITNGAVSESTGWNLKDHRGWIGTVKSVKANNKASSHYEYWIDYPNGSRNEHVLEQDLQPAPAPGFAVGQTVQIYSGATTESTGWNLKDHRNWIGTIKSVKPVNISNSKYEYWIEYPDGSRNEHVLEQDVQKPAAAKYAVGQRVKMSGYAVSETNGYNITGRRNWVGTVKSVKVNNHFNSHYSYWVVFDNGECNELIAEQDLLLP
ncbi:peptidoglycan recognition family protein [Weissella confusa]|uniref:peptidoglycan recognition family protein n=1 Tax=Weissella confusa TaxID=1583 RepID=UPI0018F20483|nr:N-acetylmuramoyl-L-alanine amidase [Weissella confusa]MBJ7662074.1 N-acetylmuramoyl-L-alanine amidase [Weissella confusa]